MIRKRNLFFLLPLFLLFPCCVFAQEPGGAAPEEKTLTGWFASGGFLLQYDGGKNDGTLSAGLSAGVGKNLNGYPLALGVQFDYSCNRESRLFDMQPRFAQSVGARMFLRTYVFSRGPLGASFDTSIPLGLCLGARGAESLSAGVSVAPTAVYFVNRRVTVFMTLSLFELSYGCTIPLQENGQTPRHRFTAGFLNMGSSGAVMGITWNL